MSAPAPIQGVTSGLDNHVPGAVDARLADLLQSVVGRRRVHHATFAITSGDGTQRWSGAAGTAGPDREPLTPQTPFFVASITKRFIATLVLQSHERDELDLDDPIVDHLPGAVTDQLHRIKGVDHTPAITIRHLLSHTSGLPDYWDRPHRGRSLFQHLAAGDDRSWTFDDVVRMTREEHTPHFVPQDLAAPRQKARYSDGGFQVLIKLLETITRKTFATLLTERILQPLEMHHTWLPGRSEPTTATAPPATIHLKDQPLDLPRLTVASNDLISTTGDLLRYHQALMGDELFSRPATTRLFTERANLLRNMIPIRYGLGTMIFRVGRLYAPGHKPTTLVGHSGVTGTWLFHCPELDLHLAGTVDQADGKSIPFRLMPRILKAWHG